LTVTAPEEVDRRAGLVVAAEGRLEAFRVLWRQPEPADELTPEPGCSTPTFHGSAADLAVVAGSIASLLAPHVLDSELHGAHLIGLPHGPAPGHHCIDAAA